MKLSVLALLALGCFALSASAIEVESSVRSNDQADAPLLKLPLNNPCARECASDAECPAQCATQCKADDLACQMDCRAACLEKATSCVAECARDFTEQMAENNGQLPGSNMRNRQPRHHSLNTGFGPETVVNWAGYITSVKTQTRCSRSLVTENAGVDMAQLCTLTDRCCARCCVFPQCQRFSADPQASFVVLGFRVSQ